MPLTEKISSNPKIKAGIIIVLFLSIFRFLVVPLQEWNTENMDRIFLLKKSILTKEKLLNQGDDIDADLKTVSEALNKAIKFFFDDQKGAGQLLLNTQKMLEKRILDSAGGASIKIKSFQWGQPSGETIIQAPVTLQMSALPEEFLNYISGIESADKFYTLDNIRMICRSRSADIQASITVSVYGVK